MNEESDDNLPPGWERASLPALCQINPPLDRCIVSDAVEVNFVPMRAVESEGAGLARPEVRRYGDVKKGYTSFLSGDVIMAKITPCMENGKTTVVPDLPGSVCFGSTEFHVIRPETGILPRWIASFLVQHDVRRNAQRAMTGGVGQMRVPSAFLESLRVPVAPTAEQGRIADALDELLSDLDAGVAALERVRDKLKLYRAAVLKAAVEGALTAEWRKQHLQTEPASELLNRILAERRRRWEGEQLRKFMEKGREPPKDWKAKYKEPTAPTTANLPALPNGWRWVSFDQLTILITKGTSPGWQGFRYQESGIRFVRSQNVRWGKLDISELEFLPPEFNELHSGSVIRAGDVLLNLVGASVGRSAIASKEIDGANLNQAVAIIRLALPNILNQWVVTYVISYQGQRHIHGAKADVARANFNLDDIRPMPIPLPPLAEQESIVDAVEDQLSVIDHLKSDLDTKLTNAQALRQSILRHAFSGKLVPHDPNDEPASELLKRIAAEREQRARELAAAKRLNGRKPKLGCKPARAKAAKKEIEHGRIADR